MERYYCRLSSCLWAVVIVAITVAAVSVSGLSEVRAQSGGGGFNNSTCDQFCSGTCAPGGIWVTSKCKLIAGGCSCD